MKPDIKTKGNVDNRRSCVTCEYCANDHSETFGQCRAHAPAHAGGWPVVTFAADWCGEHKPRAWRGEG
jgi:hypothetical protein